jgi:hypothetical protein
VLHDESKPTTSCLVHTSDADGIMDDRIDILRLDRCIVVHARVCHRRKLSISFVLADSVAGAVDSRYACIAAERDAAPRVSECRLKSMKQSSCAAFGLAVELPAESAIAGSGPCYAKAQTSSRDRELRGAFPVVRSASVKVFGCRPHEGGAAHSGAGVRKPPREETAGGVAR